MKEEQQINEQNNNQKIEQYDNNDIKEIKNATESTEIKANIEMKKENGNGSSNSGNDESTKEDKNVNENINSNIKEPIIQKKNEENLNEKNDTNNNQIIFEVIEKSQKAELLQKIDNLFSRLTEKNNGQIDCDRIIGIIKEINQIK